MKMFKNKKILIAAGVIAVLLLVSGYLLFAGKPKEESEPVVADQTIKSITPEELGLTIEPNPAKTEVKFKIAKVKGFKTVAYQLDYEADSTAAEQSEGGEPRVDRGVTGEVKIEPGDSSYESDWIVLGSESAGTKRYDKGVEKVNLTLKLVKNDNSIYQSEMSLDF